jgi:hypothetical protein
LRQAHCDAADTFGRAPSDHIIVIFQPVKQVLNNEFELLVLLVVQTIIHVLLLIIAALKLILDLLNTRRCDNLDVRCLQVRGQRAGPALIPPLGHLRLQKDHPDPLSQVNPSFLDKR